MVMTAMARSIPADRFAQLVDAATKTFVARGYRLTQMADVAEALGVAKGTLYGYVESKEALFDACVRYADGQRPLPTPAELPLATPAPGATIAHIREQLVNEARELLLLSAIDKRARSGKVAQEHYTAAWARQAGAAAVALRYHNVYGPLMPRDTPYSGVAAMFRSSLERGEPPQVFEDGRQMRDFVHVSDVARANALAVAAVADAGSGAVRQGVVPRPAGQSHQGRRGRHLAVLD